MSRTTVLVPTLLRPLVLCSLALALACTDSHSDPNTPAPDATAEVKVDAAVADANSSPLPDATVNIDARVGELGETCGSDAEGLACGEGLACCYPCGIEGCDFKCMSACNEELPVCSGGCLLAP
ncbi:MAG: hypothetical protein GY811_08795 [Myxococcales bacterium]|nr:hypothetical protein [Myxococcales bacterium]